MIIGLDAVQLTAIDPASAGKAYQALLGQEPADLGGAAIRFQLANAALEIRAGDGDRLAALAFAVEDLGSAAGGLRRRGLAFTDEGALAGGPGPGVDLRLTAARAARAVSTSDEAVAALDHVVIATRRADRALALYGARLGLDLRLDRRNPAFGARLLFFRCGEAVLEISAPLDETGEDAPDRISGLAWRVKDPAAARARLAGAGFDVSDVRPGRKPGTAVFTLRSGVVGAPALIIGPDRAT